MTMNRASGVLGRFRGAAVEGGADRLPDRELLDRFVLARDSDAFESLLARHGPMVLAPAAGLCPTRLRLRTHFRQRFSSSFGRRAHCGGLTLLGNWLFGVACRIAARSRVETARRRLREGAVRPRTPSDPLADITARELVAAVYEVLFRLPARYRTPLVACYLDGQTRDEAAAALGWSVATLGRWLARGRDLLRARLARGGLALSAALLPASLVCVPSALAAPVLTAARFVAEGQAVPVGLVPASVETLTRKVADIMFIGKLKTTAAVLLAAGLVLIGVGTSHME
jgi:DNA-directed RNA polymerase specialized sigma24 family protein